jgi:hypothetical protein
MHQRIAHLHLAAEHGAGDHRALARQREAAVHGQAEQPVAGARGNGLGAGHEVIAQPGHAFVIGLGGGGGKDRGAGQRRGGQQGIDLGMHLL